MGIAVDSLTVAHDSATIPGGGPPVWAEAVHAAAAATMASAQSGMCGGGQCSPTGGETTNRYASACSRTTSVRANTSGGHPSIASVIG